MERGMLENEIILRDYISLNLNKMNQTDLDTYERLLEIPDPDLYEYLSGKSEVPEEHNSTLIQEIKNFTLRNPNYRISRPNEIN